MTDPTGPLPACPRRTVLRGVALASVAGAGLTGLTACDVKARDADGPTAPVDLGAADAVPVGGAKLYRESKVVVAQPVKGTFKAFSAVCTHQGCVVDSLTGTTVSCPCHGSEFNAETGAVVQGPASAPLPAVRIVESGGRLTAGPAASGGKATAGPAASHAKTAASGGTTTS